MSIRKQLTRWSPLRSLAVPAVMLFAVDGAAGRAEADAEATARPVPRAFVASSPLNRIDGLQVEELDDGSTVLRISGTKKPTFNVYRMGDPDRLVVDVSGSERGKVVPHVPLDTWSCGRVRVSGVSERGAKLSRIVVELKREVSYIVVPDGHDLVVTVTPREVPPEAYFARKSATVRRAEIERDARDASALKAEAKALNEIATRKARDAERRAHKAAGQVDQAKAIETKARRAQSAARKAEEEARKAASAAKRDRGKAKGALQKAEEARKRSEAELKRAAAARAQAERRQQAAEAEAQKQRAKAEEARRAAEAARNSAEQAKASAEAARKSARRDAKAAALAKANAEKDRRSAAQERESAAKARKNAAKDRQSAAKERASAQAERRTAKQVKLEAQAALARAEKAMVEAREERESAQKAKLAAVKALSEARKQTAKAKKRGKNTAELDRALAQAKQAEKAAKARQRKAEATLTGLKTDRDRLEQRLKAQEERSASLEKRISAREQELAALESKVAEARRTAAGKGETARQASMTSLVLRKEVERLQAEAKQERSRADAAQRKAAELEKGRHADKKQLADARARAKAAHARVSAAERELDDRKARLAEANRRAKQQVAADTKTSAANKRARKDLADAEAKLGRVQASLDKETKRLQTLQNDVEKAQARLDKKLAQARKQEQNLAKQWKSERKKAGTTKITNVTFEDGEKESRVVLKLDGPIEYAGSSLTPTLKMLKLNGAKIPKGLERSLDASGYGGPVKMITSFGEGDDVKVIVSTAGKARPTLEEKPGQLIWHFPRTKSRGKPEAVSLAGTKVGGFASPAPAAMMQQPAPVRRSGRRSKWRGERIDIELQDAPIKDVLLLFSDIGRVNIIAGRGVAGAVTLKLTAVPWDQALDIILRSLSLGMSREGNVIRVATLADIEDERRKAIDEANAKVQLKPLQTRLVAVSYATVDEMIPKVQSVLSSRGSVTPDSRTNTLIIMDVAENIAIAEQLVAQLDSQTPQVLIEARVVEARTNFLRQLGIQWGFDYIASAGTGNPTGLVFPSALGVAGGASSTGSDTRGFLLPNAAANPNYAVDLPAPAGTGAGGAIGFSFGSITGNLNTNLRLSAAEDTGEVRIISAPKIVTLDNTPASIEQGVQIPISQVSAQGVNTRYVNATLALSVTPHVTNEGAVLMDVVVQKNEADFINTGARGDPTILTKQAQSRMLVTDGDTAVIGGIYTRNKSVAYKKVPWFAEIPIIGWFFKNKAETDQRTEVLIFLTPKIVNRASSIGT